MSGPHYDDPNSTLYVLTDPGQAPLCGPDWEIAELGRQDSPPPSGAAGDGDRQGLGTDPSRS